MPAVPTTPLLNLDNRHLDNLNLNTAGSGGLDGAVVKRSGGTRRLHRRWRCLLAAATARPAQKRPASQAAKETQTPSANSGAADTTNAAAAPDHRHTAAWSLTSASVRFSSAVSSRKRASSSSVSTTTTVSLCVVAARQGCRLLALKRTARSRP